MTPNHCSICYLKRTKVIRQKNWFPPFKSLPFSHFYIFKMYFLFFFFFILICSCVFLSFFAKTPADSTPHAYCLTRAHTDTNVRPLSKMLTHTHKHAKTFTYKNTTRPINVSAEFLLLFEPLYHYFLRNEALKYGSWIEYFFFGFFRSGFYK